MYVLLCILFQLIISVEFTQPVKLFALKINGPYGKKTKQACKHVTGLWLWLGLLRWPHIYWHSTWLTRIFTCPEIMNESHACSMLLTQINMCNPVVVIYF